MASMCEYCTKLCLTKKISDHISNNLFVHINEFLNQLKQGFILTQKVPLFVHTNIVMKNGRSNFGGLYYESISSPFMLWKFYLDIISRTVFNVNHQKKAGKYLFVWKSLMLKNGTMILKKG